MILILFVKEPGFQSPPGPQCSASNPEVCSYSFDAVIAKQRSPNFDLVLGTVNILEDDVLVPLWQ
jgi:hypothetical protein